VTLLQELLGAMAAAGSEAEVDHQRESDGQTAYHQACFWNRKECAAALVEAGCDTGLVEKYGKVGRQLAANRKLTDMLATLDSLGAAQEVRCGQAPPHRILFFGIRLC
jgi:ankyrin repeat protein